MFDLYFKVIDSIYTKKFRNIVKESKSFQEKLLLDIIKNNQSTIYGDRFDFKNISSINDFKSKVPINSYSDLEEYINLIKDGGENILTKEKIIFFSTTSGTTDHPKYIPLTKTYLKKRETAWKIWESQMHQLISLFNFKSKVLTFTSKPYEGKTLGGINYGNITGLLKLRQPKLVTNLYAVPNELMYIEDFELRYYLTALFALREEISLLATPNPSTVLVFSKVIKKKFNDILLSFKYNKINFGSYSISDSLKDVLNSKFENKNLNSKTYFKLSNISRTDFKLQDILNVKLLGVWTGGSVGFYVHELENEFPNSEIRDVGYMASEGRFSINLKENKFNTSTLDVSSSFYEFIDINQFKETEKFPETLLSHELKVGKKYYIYFTNETGLYRYKIDDIIEVVDFINETPVIKFVQKGKYFSSLTGEKISEWELVEIMKKIKVEADFQLTSFIALPKQTKESSNYIIYFSSKKKYSKKELSKFSKILDSYLSELNIEYKSKRKSLRLDNLQVEEVSDSFFLNLRRAYSKSKKHDFQVKTPKLIVLEKDKKIVEELLKR